MYLNRGIIRERILTNSEFFDVVAVLQIEVAIGVVSERILPLGEAILPDLHLPQLLQTSYIERYNIGETTASDGQLLETGVGR